ncbi:MAG TPA: hypothetical protein PLI95_27585, partial [Polyangiaceae bacterium]|nr:hypothetical protein [Polyangiaceae bacterium]
MKSPQRASLLPLCALATIAAALFSACGGEEFTAAESDASVPDAVTEASAGQGGVAGKDGSVGGGGAAGSTGGAQSGGAAGTGGESAG